jgi:hypothetical protein
MPENMPVKEPRVARESAARSIHFAHPALAEQGDDFVVTEFVTD